MVGVAPIILSRFYPQTATPAQVVEWFAVVPVSDG
jgi:hypothetical protein